MRIIAVGFAFGWFSWLADAAREYVFLFPDSGFVEVVVGGTTAPGVYFRLLNVLLFFCLGVVAAAILTRSARSESPGRSARLRQEAVEQMGSGYALHEALFDASGTLVDFRYLELNHAAEKILGRPRREVTGRTALELFPHFRETGVLRRCSEVMATGEPQRFDDIRYGDDGVEQASEISVYRVDPRHFGCTFRDVTRQRRSEEALRQSERRYRSLFEDSKDGIYSVTREGRLVEFNRAGLEMLGYTWSELEGRTTESLYVDPGLRRDFQKEIEATGSVRDFAVRLRRKDGQVIDCLLTSSVRLGENGEIEGYQGIIHDVTTRMAAERDLRASERRFRATFEQAAVGIAHVGLDGSFLLVNQKLCEMLGFRREELLCKTLFGISVEGDDARDARLREDLLAGRVSTHSVEKRFLRKDGSPVEATLTVSLHRDLEGGADYFICVIADITRQKDLEEQFRQAQKMEALGRLAGGVAHDFNNLLTGLLGYSELALDETDPASPIGMYLKEVHNLGDRAKNLTAQLLTFSRRQPTRKVSLDPNELIQESVNMLRRTLGEDIELIFEPGREIGNIRGDAGQLEQVLLNLAINARDAMPSGGILRIGTSLERTDPDSGAGHPHPRRGSLVCIAVSDTGHGMDEVTIDRIFEPFFTTKESGLGTGLGLAMVHGIVTRHGGHVTVRSQPGKGAAFKVCLPRFDPEPAVQHSGPASAELVPGGSETVLLVEDETAVRVLISQALEKFGYRVLAAANPREAREVFRRERESIDLLLTDVVMPGETGVDLYKSLIGLEPNLPVLFMSGYTRSEQSLREVPGSRAPFLQKPFRPSELGRRIRMVLDTSARRSAEEESPG